MSARPRVTGWMVGGLTVLLAATAVAANVPRPAPPLSLISPAGERYTIEGLRGKVVMLEFFSTECPHCQRSAQNIMTFYRQLKPRGLEVLAVATNPGANTLIPEFARRFGVTYPMVVGNTSIMRTFATGELFVPYVFFIDRKGVIRFEHPGQDSAFHSNEIQNARAEIELLLKEQPAAKKAKKAPSRN